MPEVSLFRRDHKCVFDPLIYNEYSTLSITITHYYTRLGYYVTFGSYVDNQSLSKGKPVTRTIICC